MTKYKSVRIYQDTWRAASKAAKKERIPLMLYIHYKVIGKTVFEI